MDAGRVQVGTDGQGCLRSYTAVRPVASRPPHGRFTTVSRRRQGSVKARSLSCRMACRRVGRKAGRASEGKVDVKGKGEREGGREGGGGGEGRGVGREGGGGGEVREGGREGGGRVVGRVGGGWGGNGIIAIWCSSARCPRPLRERGLAQVEGWAGWGAA